MSWKQEAANDSPIWRGVDSIANEHGGAVKAAQWICGACAVVGVAFIASGGFGVLLGIASLLIASSYFLIQAAGVKPAPFIHQPWQLHAQESALEFKGATRWTVPLDAVASVETGRTQDFMPSRKVGALTVTTSPHEWQTFLFLNDGTRRVIYHANSARDECVALAASIREYLNAAAPAVAPSAPVAAPRPSAFDL